MRRTAKLAVVAASALAWCAPAGAAGTDVRIAMSDGVEIAATLHRPEGAGPHPAVLLFHGIGESRHAQNAVGISLEGVAEQVLVPAGYAALTVDLRAHGESGGLFTLDGPREAEDTRELRDWLTAQPGIDGERIGLYAYSLGGGLAWRAAVEGVPFGAYVIGASWTDLRSALAPQGLVKSGAVYGFLGSVQSKLDPSLAPLAADLLAGRNLATVGPLLDERSARGRVATVRAPVLMLQGRRDFAFGLDQVTGAFRSLAGPRALYVAGFGHAPSPKPPEEIPHAMALARAWFDHWLRGIPNGVGAAPRVELAHDPWDGKTTSYAGLPRTRVWALRARGTSRIRGEGSVTRGLGRAAARRETFGAPVVTVRASGTFPQLVAVLAATTPDGRRVVVAEGGVRTRLGPKPRTVTIRLASQATAIPRGSRLSVRLGATSGDLLYILGIASSARLTVGDVVVRIPVLRRPVSR